MDTTVLDAPGNTDESTDDYLLQICISWLEQPASFRGLDEPTAMPATNQGRVNLFRSIGASWAEPFRSLAMKVRDDDEVKGLKLMDWVPPTDLRSQGRAVLMGDSLHVMTMCKCGPFFFLPSSHAVASSFSFLLFLLLLKSHLRHADGSAMQGNGPSQHQGGMYQYMDSGQPQR